ncbi:hypothetical protein JCM16358_22950 [Halanaerocella petrolearia]
MSEEITDWKEADQTLKELAELKFKKKKVENEMKEIIAEAKAEYGEDLAPLEDKIAKLAEELEEFVADNREDFDGKSKQLNFGTVGHRKSIRLEVPKEKEEEILARLRELGMNDCINVKTVRKVDKRALKNYSDQEIQSAGIDKVESDNFYYKTS